MTFYDLIDSPVGTLGCAVDGAGNVVSICFLAGREENEFVQSLGSGARRDPIRVRALTHELQDYFSGKRRHFNLPLKPTGTEFQQQVWKALRDIPYGETRSYAQIARSIGRPKAVRAVGAANGANPIPIVIPCHRVIGADGSMTGFGGGLEAKVRLLSLEKAR
ncbi:MAG TPA: methylated-DNA--[protein]-cysteine S-methyltransferase [Acidobacteriota bacterium]|nr:methylated-DNA--[protein]-cysteine S-methyltransferase [Acidobacteriota bacterium]